MQVNLSSKSKDARANFHVYFRSSFSTLTSLGLLSGFPDSCFAQTRLSTPLPAPGALRRSPPSLFVSQAAQSHLFSLRVPPGLARPQMHAKIWPETWCILENLCPYLSDSPNGQRGMRSCMKTRVYRVDGCRTGNGEKLSNIQVCYLAQLCLAAASFLSVSCATYTPSTLYSPIEHFLRRISLVANREFLIRSFSTRHCDCIDRSGSQLFHTRRA